jgi:ABC-type oligopeptide transport system substrate-binding subunit
MSRGLWIASGALALAASALALAPSAGTARPGGVFRVLENGASVQIDPQLAYVTTAWWLEYATAAKLFNYPDRAGAAGWRLTPEVASRFLVSNDGRRYTFFIRKGFRFSDGSPVTAKSFAYAIDRVASHALASPGAAFITDRNGTEIVGARAVNDRHATHVRGVVANGNRLTVHLAHRDETLPTKLAMPFFQATSTKLPLNSEVTTGYPSAGPYFVRRNEVDTLTELRRNLHYGGSRPSNLSGVQVRWNMDRPGIIYDPSAFDQLPVPAAEVPAIAKRYGVNKSRFWVKPVSCLGFLAFNTERPLFRNNPSLRRALNWGVSRRAYAATFSPYTASPWTHLLLPGTPGSIEAKRLQPYANTPRLGRARRLAAGHLHDGKITVAYRSTGSGPAQLEVVRRALIQLGFGAEGITTKGFAGGDIYEAMGKRGTDIDLGVSAGWCSQSGDPTFMLEGFVAGSPKYHRRLEAAKKLSGMARLRALGRLDIALMKEVAPAAVMRTHNNLYYFSSRVDPKSLVYQGLYSDWSIPALALK